MNILPIRMDGQLNRTIHQQKEINGLLKWGKSRSISVVFSVSESKNKDFSLEMHPQNIFY